MNVVKSSSQSESISKGISSKSQAQKINLYQDFPKGECSIDDFEEYALMRLKVSRA
jgi:hypothetical protein